ncbi:MAG: [FeFe] hydrogenase H-cluster maturation GTPase HydF [Alphaproteobacteria bacterium]|nr:[FeFe] hydrogenase H-cluster maturation GTPase HydF [Alphaproteobacteria bacterium]
MNKNFYVTPRGLRTIITIIGRRNAGKSSLINALCEQNVAIVSAQAGTTTDAVAKPYELFPIGPVTFYDTAGLDDEGDLGIQRINATNKIITKSDIVLIVIGNDGLQENDFEIIRRIREMNIPFAVIFNKTDIAIPKIEDKKWVKKHNIPFVEVSAEHKDNIDNLKKLIVELVPAENIKNPEIASDLFEKGDVVVLVTPVDYSAPKGRLILPQVQVLREILDKGAKGIVVQDGELEDLLGILNTKPALVIADSKVIMKVASIVPKEIPLTTFSILFARNKGDIETLFAGAMVIDKLKDGDKILIAEACSHHVQEDDIGKVKIPNLIKKYTGKNLEFDFCQGIDFPENMEQYSLVVHCGGCMINRMEMMYRMRECVCRGVKISNYGVVISKTQGVLDRVLAPLGLT